MGYYIETGTNHCKASLICREHGGVIIPRPINYSDVPKGKALICVVTNPYFEAAAFCNTEQEFKEFTLVSDTRPKTWLLIDWKKACKLTNA